MPAPNTPNNIEENVGYEASVPHIFGSKEREPGNASFAIDFLRRNFRKLILAAVIIGASLALCGVSKKAKAETNFSPEQIAQLDIPEGKGDKDKEVFDKDAYTTAEKKEKTPEELFRVFLKAPDETEKALNVSTMPFDTEGWLLIAECDKSVPDSECIGRSEKGQAQTHEEILVINPDGTQTIRRLVIFSLSQVKSGEITFGSGAKTLTVKVPVYTPHPALEPIEKEKPSEEKPAKKVKPAEKGEAVQLLPEHPEHPAGVIDDIIDKALKDPARRRRFFRVTAGFDVTAFTNDPDKREANKVNGGIDSRLLWNTDKLRLGVGGGLSYSNVSQGVGNPEGVEVIDRGSISGNEFCFNAGSMVEKVFPIGGRFRTGVSGGIDFEGCFRSFNDKKNIGVSSADRTQMMDVKGARRFVSGLRPFISALLEHANGFFASVGFSPRLNITPVQKNAGSDAEESATGSMDIMGRAGYQF